MSNALKVYWKRDIVGRLWIEEGQHTFQYDSEWVQSQHGVPLSIKLPLIGEAFKGVSCKIFFSNLLPEGNVRTLIARKLGISESNDFELLKAIGGDCAGAISLIDEDEELQDSGDYELISEKELNRLIEGMSQNPLLTWKENMRLSLAGAQQKLPVYVQDNKIYIPHGNFASSHILKPASPNFSSLIENEAFCMTLAKRCGLPVPDVSIQRGKNPIFLIERYDRVKNEQGRIERIHQEDFCQALGYSYSEKYEGEGGPTLKLCFGLLLNHSTQPIIDKKILIEWVVFNYLIGNCDAHAKNISMMISRENYSLAPLYDLVSTIVYPDLSKKFAMKIGGQSRPDWVQEETLIRFAEDAQVGEKAIIEISGSLCEKIIREAKLLEREFSSHYGENSIVKNICKNIDSYSKKLKDACL